MSNDRYLTISSYAAKCGVTPDAIYCRLDKGDPNILMLTKVDGLEGLFIDTLKYPPIRYARGRKTTRQKLMDYIRESVLQTKNIQNEKDFAAFVRHKHKEVAKQIDYDSFARYFLFEYQLLITKE